MCPTFAGNFFFLRANQHQTFEDTKWTKKSTFHFESLEGRPIAWAPGNHGNAKDGAGHVREDDARIGHLDLISGISEMKAGKGGRKASNRIEDKVAYKDGATVGRC